MTDIALDFKEETASVNRLGESLRQLKIAADAANQSSLDKLRGAIAALGLGSREHLQQIAVDTRSILQKLQQEVKQTAVSNAKDITVSLAVEAAKQAEIQATAIKSVVAEYKAAAASQKAIDKELHANRVASMQFEAAQRKMQIAESSAQAAIDASLHKNRIANLQFEAAQQLQLAKTAQQQIAAAMNSSTAPYQLYNANTLRAGSVVNAPTNPIHPKAIADTNALNVATASLTSSHKVMNDGVRGLVQSLGMYSSTLSAIIPMLAGMAIGAGLKNMLDQGRDLEYQMTFIAKLTDGAVISVDQFSRAMEGSQLTTKEGAAGLRALAQAGLSAEDALIALPDVMNLAVVGEMQLGAAALVATGIMHAFNLQLTDMPHIIDVMTKAAAVSNTSVEGMATAMKTASVVSDQFGVSLEEVSSGLVVMAKRNIEGTSAGTAMKNFITNLASTTPIAAARMKQLGIEVYDTEGNLKKMAQIIPELATAFVGLNEKTKNEALKDLFNERGRRAAAALIKDVTLYGEVLGKLANESKGFAANVVSGLDHTITGQIKATANALSITFDEAFAHTSNAWSNLIAQFTDAASSSGLRLFIEDAAKAVITLVDNLGKLAIAAGAVGLAVVAWQTYSAAVIAAEAASVAAGLTVARTAVTLEAQAAAAAAAASATGVFSAVLARIAWPVAIVTALWGAFEFLSGQVDAATEAQKRYAREGQDTISKLDALIAKTNEESAALRLQTQENISLAEAVRRVRREKGLSASGEDQGQAALVKAAKELETAQANYKKAFDTKWSAGEEAAKLKEATANYFAAIAANREMVRQAPEQLLKQQEADLSLGVKAIRTATQDNAEILREKIVEGQNYLAELKKTTPKDPKIGRLESTIADLQRLDKGLALVGETVANNIKITADGALSPETLQTLKETQGLAKGAAKELDKLFISRDKPESGFGAGGRSPHVEKVKLETSNIVEELSKRNKLVMEADKASAANRKAVLDAEFAANLISRGSYEAEVEYLREKSDTAAIAELTRQQEVRVAAYIAADEEIQKAQEKFNSLNASNAKAIEANDEHIAAVRANNANKYITDYLTSVNAISTIQQKANTDARLVELKHQEALQKIKQEGLDWEASEIELKAKNARAAASASSIRRTTSSLQAAVLTAENSEFERLTANANKYDAEIKKLRESVLEYNEIESVGIDLSSEAADLADRRSKSNAKTITQLTELVDRKNKLAAGIPVELKFKGTEATELFISTEAVRIRDGLTDAIMGAGKDGGAGLRNFLEAELLTKPFRMVIQATMEPIAQSLANSLWGGVGGGLASNGGVGGSIVNSMLGAVIGKGATMSSLGSAFGAGFSSTLAGNGLLSGASAGTAATGGTVGSGVAGAIGSAAPYIIAAAVAAGVLQRAQGSVTAAGTFVYGHNSATGFKTGGRADFIQEGGGGTTKNSSWFDPGEATSKYMSAMADLVTTSVKGWAEAIGLSADAVNGYTETVQAAIGNGMSKAEERQSIDKAMAGYGDAMVQALFGEILVFAKSGEAASATLERLGTDLVAVNGVLAGFDKPLFDASFEGAKSVQMLLNSVGGLDKFSALAANLEAVNGVLLDLGQTTFDVTLEGARAAQTLALSVGGLDKLSTMAASLTKVNENLGKLGEPLQEISVAGAKAAQSMLKATEVAVKTKEAADKLNTDANNFSKSLLVAGGKPTTSVLQRVFEQAMTEVAKAVPSLVDWNAVSRVTPEDYMGYSEFARTKLDAAVSAYSELSNAIKTSADAATATAKTAQDTATTAVTAYEDALAAIEKSTRDARREVADFGKTDLQKALSKIDYTAQGKQAELDALSSKAAALSSEATAVSLKASNASLDSTGTLTEGLILYSATVKDNSKEVVANISETLQNTTKALGDSLTLVPAIAALFAEILKGLEKIPTALQAVSAAVSGLGSASSSAAGGVSSLAMASAAAGTSAAGATPSVTAMGGAFNAVAPAATAAGTALNSLGSSFDAAGAALNSLGSAFDTAAAGLTGLVATFGAAAAALDGLNTSFNSAATGLSGLSSAFDSVAGSGADFAGTLATVGGAFFSVSSAAASAAGGITSTVSALSSAASAAASIKAPVSTSTALAFTADNVLTKAGGGAIYGPGTSISDDIPAMLSNGEYVIKAASVSKYGVRFMDALNAGQLKNTVYRYTGTPLSNPLVTLTETEKTAVYLQKFADVVGQLGGVLQRVEGTADTSTKINVLNPETLSQALSKITSIPISDTNSKPRFDISGKDAAGVSQYFLDLLKANPPTQDSSGNLSFSADAAKALGPLADVLDSVNTVITRLKEQQGWQDKLAVLSGKKLQEEIDLQSELANATDDATKSLIKQVYAQEQQKKADDKVLGLRGSSAQLLVDDVRLKGDRFTADAMQRQLDLYGADGKSGITAGLTAEGKGQVVAQYDLNAKYKAQIASDTAILEAQKAAQEHYLDTIDKVTEAQKKYASTLTSTIKGFKDFLKTLDVKSATGSDLRSSRTSFNELAKQAAAGDTSVYEKLVPAAQEMLDLSTKYSKTLQEYRRDEANVRNVLNSVIDKSQEQLDKLPDVSLEGDAIKTAWQDLQKATTAQANASVLLAAMGVDQADILTRRRTAEEALIKQYEDAIKLRPDYAQFQVEFNNKIVELKDSSLVPEIGDTFKLPEGTTVETLITDRLDMLLPTEGVTPINFVKVFTDRVGLILPDGFAGDEIDLALMLTTKVNGILPDNMAGEGFKLAEMLTTRVGVMMPTNFAGPEFNAKTIVSDQLTKVVMPDTMAGAPFNAKTIVSDQITKVVMPDAMAGPTFSAKTIVSDQVTEVVLRKGFAGPEFSLVGIATARLYNDILPANFAGVAFNAQAVFYTRLSEILPVNIGGDSFNAAQMMQAAIDRAVASSATAVAGTTTATSTSGNSSSYTRPFEAVSLDYDLERARDYARRALGLPSFAVGTSYVPYDMTANIHEGEEITPRPYVDAQRSDREQTNALLVRLIKSNEAMQAELAQLRASAAATAASTKNTERVLVRVSRDGNSLLTTPA